MLQVPESAPPCAPSQRHRKRSSVSSTAASFATPIRQPLTWVLSQTPFTGLCASQLREPHSQFQWVPLSAASP